MFYALHLLWALSLVLGSSAQSPINPIATKPHRNVCTLPYASMDICGTNGTVANFTGYELEVGSSSS